MATSQLRVVDWIVVWLVPESLFLHEHSYSYNFYPAPNVCFGNRPRGQRKAKTVNKGTLVYVKCGRCVYGVRDIEPEGERSVAPHAFYREKKQQRSSIQRVVALFLNYFDLKKNTTECQETAKMCLRPAGAVFKKETGHPTPNASNQPHQKNPHQDHQDCLRHDRDKPTVSPKFAQNELASLWPKQKELKSCATVKSSNKIAKDYCTLPQPTHVKTRERRGSSFSQLGLEPNHTGLTAQSLFFLEESCRVKRSDTQTFSNFSNYFKRVLKLQKRSSSFSK